MKKNIILYTAGAFALAVIIFLVFMVVLLYRSNQALQVQLPPSGGGNGKNIDPYISGPVKNRILKGYSDIRKCYLDYLVKKPTVCQGRVKADWQIGTNGETDRPEIVSSSFQDPGFERCITGAIAKWSFPEPPVKKYVSHEFTFKDVKGK